jgi:L1 cell adhesion molecule like protein
MQLMWSTLYKANSSGDQGTLYQLRTIIQRRNVVNDPKNNFHACSEFFNVVLDAHIATAAAQVLGCEKVEEINLQHLFPSGEIPPEGTEQLRAIEKLAAMVVDRFAMYEPEEVCQSSSDDHVHNYACLLLTMGLLARNFQDSSREGDGERIIRCWRFLFLHYKEGGHTKYILEAFYLLADLDVMLSAREAHALKWNRTCSVRGGLGSNVPLDLKMEHLNRDFKESISRFASTISETNVKRVSKATKELSAIKDRFDGSIGLKPQSSVTCVQATTSDFTRVISELEKAKVFSYQARRCHSAFQAIPKHPFAKLVKDMDKLHDWIKTKKSELAKKEVFKEFCRKRRESAAISTEHSYAIVM